MRESELSRDAEVASVYWSVNADMTFTHAAPLDHHTSDLAFGEERAREDSLRLIERITGIALHREWFDAPDRCVDVTPLPAQR